MLHHFKRTLGATTGLLAMGIAASAEGGPVDLQPPSFRDPTSITNPLFPVSAVRQSVKLGEEGGEPMRVELSIAAPDPHLRMERPVRRNARISLYRLCRARGGGNRRRLFRSGRRRLGVVLWRRGRQLRRRPGGRPRRVVAGRAGRPPRPDHARRSAGGRRLSPREHTRPGLRGSDGPGDRRNRGRTAGSGDRRDTRRRAPHGGHEGAQNLRAGLRRVPRRSGRRAGDHGHRRADRQRRHGDAGGAGGDPRRGPSSLRCRTVRG